MIAAKSKPLPRRSQSRARATPKRWRNGRVSEMRVGILGSGLMGGKLGTIFARAGHDVVFSYARSEQKLKQLARDVKGKAQAGTPREAAEEADALLLAVHWSRVDDVLKQAGDVSGKVIVTCSLPIDRKSTRLNSSHGYISYAVFCLKKKTTKTIYDRMMGKKLNERLTSKP